MAISLLKAILAIVFIELYLFSLWPALFLYAIPKFMHKKMSTDIMFLGTYFYAFNVLFFIPLFTLATLLVTLFTTGSWWMALAHVAILPFLAIFACKYTKFIANTARDLRWLRASATTKGKQLKQLHNELWNRLDIVFNKR